MLGMSNVDPCGRYDEEMEQPRTLKMQICILRIGQRPPNRWKNVRADPNRQSVKNVMDGGF
jgi:hypothetical protein